MHSNVSAHAQIAPEIPADATQPPPPSPHHQPAPTNGNQAGLDTPHSEFRVPSSEFRAPCSEFRPPTSDFTTVGALSELLGCGRSTIRHYANVLGFHFSTRYVGPRKKRVACLSTEEAAAITAAYEAYTSAASPSSSSSSSSSNSAPTKGALAGPAVRLGWLCLLQLEPDADPTRVQVAFTRKLDGRIDGFLAHTPYALCLAQWPARAAWESTAIDSITQNATRIRDGIFRSTDHEALIDAGDRFFGIMPTLPHAPRTGPQASLPVRRADFQPATFNFAPPHVIRPHHGADEIVTTSPPAFPNTDVSVTDSPPRTRMKTFLPLIVAALSVAALGATPPPAQKDVSALLAPVIQKHNVPGMAGAVVRNGELVALGAAGVRTRGKPETVAAGDLFHIGSDTKAFTAMLCGILVDEGKLKWSQTLGETFPDLRRSMHPQYHGVTLEQLLTNRGGAPGDLLKDPLWGKLWAHRGTPAAARRLLLEGVTAKAPEGTPGKFIYSNAGFSIAGHMAEKVTGKSWEDLTRERIFRPLGMTSAGFGAPGTRSKNDQPRGHGADGAAVQPGPAADNPVAIGPAGIIHCSLADWAKFAMANLPSGKTKLVKPETLEKLHTPAPSTQGEPKYAMGWAINDDQPWAGGPALTHAGSNTMWFAVAWLAPKKDFAVLVACNQASFPACNDAVVALIADHFQSEAQ